MQQRNVHRWHAPACRHPDVEVLIDHTPYCRTCGHTPRVTDVVANKVSAGSIPRVPPDVRLGELDLWWPRSVCYLKSAAPPLSPCPKPVSQPPRKFEPEIPEPFRLICLEAAASPGDPIHLMLEVYCLDNCPEYETVSYTWAGEDGDGRLCKPIYIGKYWDLLLQTNNCWEMLRFMRPRRWTRLIWVDAICINQSNIRERNQQVGNMGRIYSACSRVVVYLGPDIAVPLHDRHPRRRRLHELASDAVKLDFAPSQRIHEDLPDEQRPPPPPHNLGDLLRRRFFSRIWVVQELLLTRSVVIRVGDVDFWADVGMRSQFRSKLPDWDWGATSAAWVQHTSKGRGCVRDLKELLSLTSLSEATDPRDRIFGLLGIIPVSASADHNEEALAISSLTDFEADYSLSCQHVFIGLFAYCLINLQQSNILYHAACLSSNRRHFPSWMPNWNSTVTWRILFCSPNLTAEDLFNELQRLIDIDSHLFELFSLCGPGKPEITAQRRWDKDAYVDATSGSLNIYLTQYMHLTRKLRLIGRLKEFYIFVAHFRMVSVYLVSEYRLDVMISDDDQVELFILANNGTLTYLLLRREADEDGEERHSLVSACPFVFIRFPADLSQNIIPELRPLFLYNLQYSLHDFAMEIGSILDRSMLALMGENMRGVFPGLRTYRDAMPVVRFLFEQQEDLQKMGVTNVGEEIEIAFAHKFASCIDAKYSPRVHGDSIIITLSTAWEKTRNVYITQAGWLSRRLQSEVPNWHVRIRGSEDGWTVPILSHSKYKKTFQPGQEKFYDVEFKAQKALELLLRSPDLELAFKELHELSFHTQETDDSLWELVTTDASEKYQFRACPKYGVTNISLEILILCNDIDMDCGTFMVTIV
ncbi:unnamed protein product [Clonostachys rhizophaga]|uniref:Heterokaryon incompatibility domain-containing protein n=1 Tax=Clonostachys rhizophaga TaxID=160324 RepID=A0A9N9W4L3_9HYPO|nr:unnamed protein product [Clonostachys rhizophaga]